MSKEYKEFLVKNLDKATEEFFLQFQKVHEEHIKSVKKNEFNFRKLIIDLGNEYCRIRKLLKKECVENELNTMIKKLELAFVVYCNLKVVGEPKEVGSMVNDLHFTLVVAKSDRYIKEAMAAVKRGEPAKSAVKRDITTDDRETVGLLSGYIKNLLTDVINYFEENNLVIESESDINKLNDFTKNNCIWSFNKLTMLFEILDKIKGPIEIRYTKENFEKVIEGDKLFSNEEKEILKELFNIYN